MKISVRDRQCKFIIENGLNFYIQINDKNYIFFRAYESEEYIYKLKGYCILIKT